MAIMKFRVHIVILATLLYATDAKSQGLYIPQGVTVTAREGNVQIKGDWINNGDFVHKEGVVTFAGDTQTLSGSEPVVFNDLSVINGAKVAMATAGQEVRGIVLSNGMLYANNNLTLLSTAIQTALVDGAGTGEIFGNMTMQRYLPNSFGYKYISSPFQDATVNEMGDDVAITSQFPSFYRYDENRQSAGWVSHTDPAFTLLPLYGYAANLGTSLSPVTVDITGVAGNGQLSLTLYNHNRPFTKGFNLVGNPYPSPVDWGAAEGWTRTNVENAVYYFNAGTVNRYKGTYSSYINGISSDGIANGVIPAMQGFFVHVANGAYPVTGTLTVNNQARINNLAPYYHKATAGEMRPLIRIKAGFVEYGHASDPVVIYSDDGATNAFEQELDALKMMNTDEQVPNLYAFGSGERLSINALSFSDTITIIPLGITTEIDGMISFDTVTLNGMPYSMHPYFVDVKTGAVQDMFRQPKYWTMLPKGVHDNRFCLVFSLKDPSGNPFFGNLFDAWGYNGKLHLVLNMMSGGKGDMIVTSISGQTIMRRAVDGFGHHEFDAYWPAGIYIVSFVTTEGTHSKKIAIVN